MSFYLNKMSFTIRAILLGIDQFYEIFIIISKETKFILTDILRYILLRSFIQEIFITRRGISIQRICLLYIIIWFALFDRKCCIIHGQLDYFKLLIHLKYRWANVTTKEHYVFNHAINIFTVITVLYKRF
jgi:hypothetical protein